MTEAQGRWVWRCWLQGPYSTEYRDKPSVACTALSAQQPRRKRHPGAGSMEPPCPPKPAWLFSSGTVRALHDARRPPLPALPGAQGAARTRCNLPPVQRARSDALPPASYPCKGWCCQTTGASAASNTRAKSAGLPGPRAHPCKSAGARHEATRNPPQPPPVRPRSAPAPAPRQTGLEFTLTLSVPVRCSPAEKGRRCSRQRARINACIQQCRA